MILLVSLEGSHHKLECTEMDHELEAISALNELFDGDSVDLEEETLVYMQLVVDTSKMGDIIGKFKRKSKKFLTKTVMWASLHG